MCSWRGDKFARDLRIRMKVDRTSAPKDTATHCSTLQHTAAHYGALQRTAALCITVQYCDMFTTTYQRMRVNVSFIRNFRKRAIKYRSLLRKMTCKDKGSYESSPPCNVSIIRSNMTCFNPSFVSICMKANLSFIGMVTNEGEYVNGTKDTLQYTATHCSVLT